MGRPKIGHEVDIRSSPWFTEQGARDRPTNQPDDPERVEVLSEIDRDADLVQQHHIPWTAGSQPNTSIMVARSRFREASRSSISRGGASGYCWRR